MVDRLVRQIDMRGAAEQEPKPHLFSAFDDDRYLVLLGAPGAGKTHLFRFFATADNRRYLTARQFLILPIDKFQGVTHLFIDALDEQRSGRDADSLIDAIAGKLVQLSIPHVRLACRAADWLGDNDLSTLNIVPDTDGAFIILALEPLSPDEQATLLRNLGALQPEQFIAQAVSRGLESMLDNPQTLTMLWQQVSTKAGEWPVTRRALFANAVDLLLSEHDIAHKRLAMRAATGEQHKAAAGAACALRLISDIRGIALQEDRASEDSPGYDEISLVPRSHLLSALASRLFTSDEIADYLHRTLAEFLAAEWLAGQVRQGLPLDRIAALITQHGIPATELRGLHAWLAVHLPEQASVLIEADPFGVMTYGDPASLSPGARRHLMSALSRLAERDPWFRAGHWQTPVSGLGQPDLIPSFTDILLTHHASAGLRSIVFDAIEEGHLAGQMPAVLCTLAKNPATVWNERRTAVDLLLHSGESGLHRVQNILAGLSDAKENIPLRTHIIRVLHGQGVAPEEMISLLDAILHAGANLPLGTFWRLDETVSEGNIFAILDGFSPPDTAADNDTRPRNLSGVVAIIGNLLCRAITCPVVPSPSQVLGWLEKYTQLRRTYYPEGGRSVGDALAKNRALLTGITTQYFSDCTAGNEPWRAVYEFDRLLTGTTDWPMVLTCAHSGLLTATPAAHPFYFEVALQAALRVGPSATAEFSQLLDRQDHPAFAPIIARYAVRELSDDHLDMLVRKAKLNAARQAIRQQRQRQFDARLPAIQAGTALEELGVIGRVYFALDNHLDAEALPHERLISEFGVIRAKQALTAAETLALSGQYPSVEDILACDARHEERDYWYTFMAGLSECHSKGLALETVDKHRLQAALIIDRLHSTLITEGNKRSVRQHSWQRELLERNPTFVAETYTLLIRHHIGLGREPVAGLSELVGYPALTSVRADYVLSLLHEYRTCTGRTLETLIACAFSEAPGLLAKMIAAGRESAAETENTADWIRWTAFGLLTGAPGCAEAIAQVADADTAESFVWAIRDAFNSRQASPHGDPQQTDVALEAFVLRFVGSRYSRTAHPNDVWGGDRNAWDASDFVIARINALATTLTSAASGTLADLAADPTLLSYRQYLQHALTTQRVRHADAHFRRPSWREVEQSLSDEMPANIADLKALVMSLIGNIGQQLSGANTDPHKQFWNVDRYGRIETPKPEEICRDVLVDKLRIPLIPLGLHVEPEGHMSSDKRADICILGPNMKLVIELKRHYHAEIWTAVEQQLDRFYTRDPDAQGFGIYGIFWFGLKAAPAVPTLNDSPSPQTAAALEQKLKAKITEKKIGVFVFDVSGE